MTGPTANFKAYLSSWFNDYDDPQSYVEGCEQAQQWLADDPDGTAHAFRDELAAHIRDSSMPPDPPETQWTTDEWLRDLWYDAFGPEPAPDDPYPIPPDLWGRVRLTPYMLHAVGESAETSSPGAEEWLHRRGLDYAIISERIRTGEGENVRPAPADWFDHLRRRIEEGRREPQPDEPWSATDGS